MKSVAVVSSLLFSGLAVAQTQSKPFNLVVKSDDKSLDGAALAACHSGAAIESLCIAGDDGSEFYFNTTEGTQAPIEGYVAPSSLIYNLPAQPDSVSSAMSFYNDPSTNVAQPLLEPGYTAQLVTVGKDDQLAIIAYLDDTVSPPTGSTPRVLKNWHVCDSYYSGYTYTTLNWVMGTGTGKPQNPSCVKVEVERKFI